MMETRTLQERVNAHAQNNYRQEANYIQYMFLMTLQLYKVSSDLQATVRRKGLQSEYTLTGSISLPEKLLYTLYHNSRAYKTNKRDKALKARDEQLSKLKHYEELGQTQEVLDQERDILKEKEDKLERCELQVENSKSFRIELYLKRAALEPENEAKLDNILVMGYDNYTAVLENTKKLEEAYAEKHNGKYAFDQTQETIMNDVQQPGCYRSSNRG